MENGERTLFLDERIGVDKDVPVFMQLHIDGRKAAFAWSYDGEDYHAIGPEFDLSKLSDEYCKYGEFTGTMVGLTCVDQLLHRHTADFDFFEYLADETKV